MKKSSPGVSFRAALSRHQAVFLGRTAKLGRQMQIQHNFGSYSAISGNRFFPRVCFFCGFFVFFFFKVFFCVLIMPRVLGFEDAPCSRLRADAKVLSPSRPVALARAPQLGLIANPAPLGAAAGGAEPVVIQVGTEAAAADLEPGRAGETTHLRWGQQEKRRKVTRWLPPTTRFGPQASSRASICQY